MCSPALPYSSIPHKQQLEQVVVGLRLPCRHCLRGLAAPGVTPPLDKANLNLPPRRCVGTSSLVDVGALPAPFFSPFGAFPFRSLLFSLEELPTFCAGGKKKAVILFLPWLHPWYLRRGLLSQRKLRGQISKQKKRGAVKFCWDPVGLPARGAARGVTRGFSRTLPAHNVPRKERR